MFEYYFTLIIGVGTPIAIGIFLIYIAFSVRKKWRIISILSILVISFALAGYITFFGCIFYVSKYCNRCEHLLRSEYNRVSVALKNYFTFDYYLSGKLNLPTLSDLAESAGYLPPEDRKSPFFNPCVKRSDLSVIISGDVEDIKIVVYAKEGKCEKLAYVGEFLRYEEVCTYLYGEDPKNSDDCKEVLWMLE